MWQTDRHENNVIGYLWQTDRHVFKLNNHKKKCVGGVFSKNIWDGASDEMKI